MTCSPSSLTQHLGFWLRVVSNGVSHSFAHKLEAHDVIVAEWVMLRELYDAGSTSPKRLSDRMAVTKGAVTKLADRLEERGYVLRVADPSDGRGQLVSITESGRAIVPALAALADANDHEFFGDLAPEDRRALDRILKDVAARRGLTTMPTT